MSLASLLTTTPDLAAVRAHLDGLTHAQRLAEVLALGGKQQALLFDAAKGTHAIRVEHFVPKAKGAGATVIHHGKNSLPLFSTFQKRFMRPAEGDKELSGYNHQAMALFTGPGYFVAYDVDDGEVLIDYTRIPTRAPEGWPALLPNSARLSRFIYNGTRDLMRGVSEHVSIGRASRDGKQMDNWFVLCREG